VKHLHQLRIEAPQKIVLDRLIDSAVSRWEDGFFRHISSQLPARVKKKMDRLLRGTISETDDAEGENVVFRQLKAEPGNVCLRSILNETEKLTTLRKVALPVDLFDGYAPKILVRYRDRVITEPAREMRRHPPHIRYALFEIFVYLRGREVTDALVDLLIQVVHRIGAQAEKNVIKKIVEEVKRVNNKNEILYKMATAVVTDPDAPARKTIFPVVGEQTLNDIVREYKHSGPWYPFKVNTCMRASYRNYYRRMMPSILKTLEFCSNNQQYRPVIDAINIVKKYLDSRVQYYL
jgi:ribosomal protein L12E/L44/L45/RPP1/RPP2